MRKFSKSELIFVLLVFALVVIFLLAIVFLENPQFDRSSIFPSHDKTLVIRNSSFT